MDSTGQKWAVSD